MPREKFNHSIEFVAFLLLLLQFVCISAISKARAPPNSPTNTRFSSFLLNVDVISHYFHFRKRIYYIINTYLHMKYIYESSRCNLAVNLFVYSDFRVLSWANSRQTLLVALFLNLTKTTTTILYIYTLIRLLEICLFLLFTPLKTANPLSRCLQTRASGTRFSYNLFTVTSKFHFSPSCYYKHCYLGRPGKLLLLGYSAEYKL